MRHSGNLLKSRRAQILMEHILLVMAVVVFLIAFLFTPNSPIKSVMNKVLYSPVGMLHSGQGKFNLVDVQK